MLKMMMVIIQVRAGREGSREKGGKSNDVDDGDDDFYEITTHTIESRERRQQRIMIVRTMMMKFIR